MGTTLNLKITHTILLVLANILHLVKPSNFGECGFMLCMGSLLLEEIANREGIQGKYCPAMVGAITKVVDYLKAVKTPSKISNETSYDMVELWVYGKLDKNSYKSFVNATAYCVKSINKFYKRSLYKDYIMDWESVNKVFEEGGISQVLNPSLMPL
jgi:hypothetical protein